VIGNSPDIRYLYKVTLISVLLIKDRLDYVTEALEIWSAKHYEFGFVDLDQANGPSSFAVHTMLNLKGQPVLGSSSSPLKQSELKC